MRRLWIVLALLGCASCAGVLSNSAAPATDGTAASPTANAAAATPSKEAARRKTEAVMTAETPCPLRITIVYDNNAYAPDLRTSWGFSAWVEFNDRHILFDTGGDGDLLLENMNKLDLDPQQLDAVVLSHAHGDHTGGLEALLRSGVTAQVYLLPSFSKSYKAHVARFTEALEASPGLEISESVYSTGEMRANVPEQALVITTGRGLVVLTGCAHPGVVQMVERAAAMHEEPVHLVLGGFHLGDRSHEQIVGIVEAFYELGVEKVAPCHCTGDRAMQVFREMYGEDYIDAGVGRVIMIEGR